MKEERANHIVWVDLEMTGLDIEYDHILEIACVVTDAELNVVAIGPSIIINQPNEVLNGMNPWCIMRHGETGLTEASRRSPISLREAEEKVLHFVKRHVPEKRCPLGGNSVYMDKIFLQKHMPRFDDYLHYRTIDISTVKELATRWCPTQSPEKTFRHRTMDGIMDSIANLKYYKEHIFKE